MTKTIRSEMSDVRDLTASEVGDVAGALMLQFGPVRVTVMENSMLLGLGIDGLGEVSIWDDGAVCATGPTNKNGTATGTCL